MRRRREQTVRRARRIAILSLLGSVLVVTLLLTAFGGGTAAVETAAPAKAARLVPAGTPRPQVVAIYGHLRLQLPIPQSSVTAVGFHGGTQGSLALEPVGSQVNQGLFARLWHKLVGNDTAGVRWYQLPGGTGASTSALDVGGEPGTDVYSPVDGTIVGLSDLVIDNKSFGQKIEIQPSGAPSIVVDRLAPRGRPSRSRSARPSSPASPEIGALIDVSSVERQSLARYTQDAGNHALIEMHPAATLALP